VLDEAWDEMHKQASKDNGQQRTTPANREAMRG
jgi:hypothetical protein